MNATAQYMAQPSLAGYISRNTVASLLNSSVSAVTVALCLPLLVRSLGPDRYALWATVGLFVTLGAMLELGIPRAMVATISGATPEQASRAFSAGIATAGLIALISSAALATVALMGINIWGSKSFLAARGNFSLILCGSAVLMLVNLTATLRGVLEAAFRLHWINVAYAVQTLLVYALALMVAWLTRSTDWVLWSSVAVYALIFGLHVIMVARLPFARLRWPDRRTFRHVAMHAGKTCVIALPGVVTLPILGYLYLRNAQRAADYGTFDLAMRVTLLAASTLSTLAMPVLAIVSSARAAGFEQLRAFIRRYTLALLVAYVCGVAIFAAIGTPLLQLAFGKSGAQVHAAALIALLGAGLASAVEPLSRSLLGLGFVRALALCRWALLVTIVAAISIFAASPNIVRFPAAYSLGNAVAAGLIFACYCWLTRPKPIATT